MVLQNIGKLLFYNTGYRQTLFKNSFWLALAEFFSKGTYFLVFIWLARHFGPQIYGQWNFALSFVGFFGVFVEFGFKILIIRELARSKDKSSEYIGNIIVMKLILSLATVGLIALIIPFLTKEPNILKLVYFLIFYIIIDNFAVSLQAIFRANEKMEYEAFCRIGESLILLGLSAFFILNNSSIVAISYAFIGAVVAGLGFSLFFLWRSFFKISLKIDFKLWKEILTKVWPFLFSGLFYMIYFETGSIMLGIFSDMKEVGYFNAAYNLFFAVFIIPEIITMSFFPKLSYLYDKDKIELKKVFFNLKTTITVISLLIGVILFFLSGVIIIKIYSSGYGTSVTVLRILSFIVLFKFLSNIYSWFLTSSNEQKKNLVASGLAAFLNIVLNYFLIIKYDAIGAALAMIITEIFLLLLCYLFFRAKWNKIYQAV